MRDGLQDRIQRFIREGDVEKMEGEEEVGIMPAEQGHDEVEDGVAEALENRFGKFWSSPIQKLTPSPITTPHFHILYLQSIMDKLAMRKHVIARFHTIHTPCTDLQNRNKTSIHTFPPPDSSHRAGH